MLSGPVPPWSGLHEGVPLLGDIRAPPFRSSGLFHSATDPLGYAPGFQHPPIVDNTTRDCSLGVVTDFEPPEAFQQATNLSHSRQQARSLRNSPSAASVHGYSLDIDHRTLSADANSVGSSPMSMHHSSHGQMPRSYSANSSVTNFSEVGSRYPSSCEQLQNPLSMRSENLLLQSGTSSPVAGASSWLTPHSPSSTSIRPYLALSSHNTLRYPALDPALPWLENILPIPVACDLLEHFFVSPSSTRAGVVSLELSCKVFRRQSFLRQRDPRRCTPGLLLSMLCLATQTSSSPFLTSAHGTRSTVGQALFYRATSLCQSAAYNVQPNSSPSLGHEYKAQEPLSGDPIHPKQYHLDGRTAMVLDDVATYYHLAQVSSSSEYKTDNIRLWNIAFSLAKENGLGQELPAEASVPRLRSSSSSAILRRRSNSSVETSSRNRRAKVRTGYESHETISYEHCEERRRMWWLLYITDRYQALSVNRAPILLETDCLGLMQPVDEYHWQLGSDYVGPSSTLSEQTSVPSLRAYGPSEAFTSLCFFGFLGPLMANLGNVIALRQSQNLEPPYNWNHHIGIQQNQLKALAESLKSFPLHKGNVEYHHGFGMPPSNPFAESRHNQIPHSQLAISYGSFIVHVQQLLLLVQWDPVVLLEDLNNWASYPCFPTATGHAIDAGFALNDILACDPELTFMPEYMGTFLLQGSLFFLYCSKNALDKVNKNAVTACEAYLRALTKRRFKLNAEYQVCYSQFTSADFFNLLILGDSSKTIAT